MAAEGISPFVISVPDEVLTDLKTRLELARFPRSLELPAANEWAYGVPTQRVKDIVEHWKTGFDWRKAEADINKKLPQFTTPIDAEGPHGILSLHFVHKRSTKPNAIPLLFSHGWPGSFLEVVKIIELLTNPTDPKDPAFHVVAPSLPGFVFSGASKSPGLGLKCTALVYDKLMKKLGYSHYVAQGGDWGALVVKSLAIHHKDSCRATHANMGIVPPPTALKNPIRILRTVLGFAGLPGGYSKREIDYLKQTKDYLDNGTGYANMQGTKPQTLAYGLTDSPTALLAWIYQGLYSWTDAYPWTSDEIITWAMLYWISNEGPVGGLRFYKEAGYTGGGEGPDREISQVVKARSNVPLGVSVFTGELFKFPDDWYKMSQPLKFHKSHDKGGHFAAYERPEELTDDVRRFTEIILKTDKTLKSK